MVLIGKSPLADLLKNAFFKLYEYEVIEKEVFYLWQKSPLEPEDKGVAEKLLISFFNYVNDLGISSEDDSPE